MAKSMTVSSYNPHPFRVGLLKSDGKSYYVRHEDYISFPPHQNRVIVSDDLGHIWVLDLDDMTSIQYEEQKQP